jgi:hypothetical protein
VVSKDVLSRGYLILDVRSVFSFVWIFGGQKQSRNFLGSEKVESKQ